MKKKHETKNNSFFMLCFVIYSYLPKTNQASNAVLMAFRDSLATYKHRRLGCLNCICIFTVSIWNTHIHLLSLYLRHQHLSSSRPKTSASNYPSYIIRRTTTPHPPYTHHPFDVYSGTKTNDEVWAKSV